MATLPSPSRSSLIWPRHISLPARGEGQGGASPRGFRLPARPATGTRNVRHRGGPAGSQVLPRRLSGDMGAARSGAGIVALLVAQSITPSRGEMHRGYRRPIPEISPGVVGHASLSGILRGLRVPTPARSDPGRTRCATRRLIEDLVPRVAAPLVLDADALNPASDRTILPRCAADCLRRTTSSRALATGGRPAGLQQTGGGFIGLALARSGWCGVRTSLGDRRGRIVRCFRDRLSGPHRAPAAQHRGTRSPRSTHASGVDRIRVRARSAARAPTGEFPGRVDDTRGISRGGVDRFATRGGRWPPRTRRAHARQMAAPLNPGPPSTVPTFPCARRGAGWDRTRRPHPFFRPRAGGKICRGQIGMPRPATAKWPS